MPATPNQDPRPQTNQPSWPERVADILRRIFVPGAQQPEPVPVPVVVGGPGLRRRV
ncbi:MAG: hypothetical protein ACRDJN_20075 [Chloroflexota bacterium]